MILKNTVSSTVLNVKPFRELNGEYFKEIDIGKNIVIPNVNTSHFSYQMAQKTGMVPVSKFTQSCSEEYTFHCSPHIHRKFSFATKFPNHILDEI